jgi:hypothetical protein
MQGLDMFHVLGKACPLPGRAVIPDRRVRIGDNRCRFVTFPATRNGRPPGVRVRIGETSDRSPRNTSGTKPPFDLSYGHEDYRTHRRFDSRALRRRFLIPLRRWVLPIKLPRQEP